MSAPAGTSGIAAARSLRISQRPPTACRECSQRKVRCDKKTPCGRCVRLSRQCTREVVRISKALSQHRDELQFLRQLRARIDDSQTQLAISDIDTRIRLLEHGKPTDGLVDAERQADGRDDAYDSPPEDDEQRTGYYGPVSATTAASMSPPSTIAISPPPTKEPDRDHRQQHPKYDQIYEQQQLERTTAALQIKDPRDNRENNSKASILAGFEFLAWGRYSQTCYPHRRCHCYQNRRYSELVSINCDPSWVGRQSMTLRVDPSLLLPPDIASEVVSFHMDHLRWHHNAFHGPTFLAQCQQFWATGTADHPLWLALYFSVCSVSLWTLLNSENHRQKMGFFYLDESLVERQFQAMVNTLYSENFLENLSLYAVQAILISTRIAHNLDRTDLNAILVGAAVRIAHCLGLHKISDAPETPATKADTPASSVDTFDWHERVEIETGKRVWLQLVIQDHFQIPHTDTYIIHPLQYITPLPKNCADYDMVEQDPSVATNSSYVRMLGRTASLIPPLLDGLGPMDNRKPPLEAYKHILECDRMMRTNVAKIPEYLLRDDGPAAAKNASVPWLPLARRTLAISAAEKIIMIHRPVLFDSFQKQNSSAFKQTRTTCVAAAFTILREHEQAIAEQSVSIWTHSAFCITAAVVLGLELFHRTDHTDDTAHTHRQMMARAADRLRVRRCDAIAKRGALLIDTMLAAEEDLVLRMMRTARTRKKGDETTEAHQQTIINEMIGSHEITARFMAIAPPKPDGPTASAPDSSTTVDVSPRAHLAAITLAGVPQQPLQPLQPQPQTQPQQHPQQLQNMGVPVSTMGLTSPMVPVSGIPDSSMTALLGTMDIDTTGVPDFDAWFNQVFNPVYNSM
ncbi:c6 zinc finger domain containing protein [Ophiostoma piceae UAMH 11346]|uniref:C6 zinc finger domain containing protein n=1 Tax=Ophiostoma piceae (strain UAMH 11346) TaxID=1262450 RepID=S3C9Y1_OPHP1|nr:c6 zinc finger domain containing protein [Ophiostoma piceae UAMH 11346]